MGAVWSAAVKGGPTNTLTTPIIALRHTSPGGHRAKSQADCETPGRARGQRVERKKLPCNRAYVGLFNIEKRWRMKERVAFSLRFLVFCKVKRVALAPKRCAYRLKQVDRCQ